ncbi:hypothetical protein Hanom_Chr09g00869861 [Helianthus anomalus]
MRTKVRFANRDFLSKLQKSCFTYVTYCKLCPLSSIITGNVLDVCVASYVL